MQSFVRGESSHGPEDPGPMTRAERLAALRGAIAQDPDPRSQVAHSVTLELLARSDRADVGNFVEGWDPFAKAAMRLAGEDGWAITVAAMANTVGVLHFAEPPDFVGASRLSKRYGYRRTAAALTRADELLGTGPAMPVATRMAMVLALTDWIIDLLADSGIDKTDAKEIAERCYQSGFWLVLAEVDISKPGPILRTPDEVLMAWDHGGIRAWRGQVAIIASNPWGPYGNELKELALAANRPAPVHAIDEAVRVFRTRFERRERELVAREIRQLVAMSGLSQREFAAMAGTSASRLSTYVNGLVTPSATMMVRIRRFSDLVQKRRAKGR
jgi:DNA-binding transcriptional regulator YiaG